MSIGRRIFLLVLTASFCLSGVCFAEARDLPEKKNNGSNLTWTASGTIPDEEILLLKTSENEGEEEAGRQPSSPPNMTAWRLHKYLGYTTVLLAAVTAVSSGSKDLHWAAAYGMVGAAALTVTTGYLAHGHRFNLENGLFDRDNAHILLGTVGAIGCIAAVALADSEGGGGHAGAGVFGGTAMALSVVTIRW